MREVGPSSPSASWNVDTLKKHIDALFVLRDTARASEIDALTKLVHAALQAAKEAVNKAEAAADKRFESVNKFREAMDDQQKTFATRTDLENLKEQVKRLEKLDVLDEGKHLGFGVIAAIVIGAVTVLGVVINIFLNWSMVVK